MNTLKRLTAILLCVLVVLSFASCHKKDETAVTISQGKESVSFTSAMYMYALIEADSAARTEVDNKKASETSSGSYAPTTTDYYKEKINGKKYVDYVKEQAILNLKRMAAYEFKAKELGVKLTDEEKGTAQYTAYSYWSGGYSTLFEPNGVSNTTFAKSYEYYQLGNSVFAKIYGEGGEKAVPAETVTKTMKENFELASIISASTKDLSESAKADLKAKLQKYADRINSGTSFETIYCEYNNTKPQEYEKVTDGSKPLDPYATVVGSKETSQADASFDTILKTAVGKAFIDDTSTEGQIRLIVRGNLQSDPYYVKNMKNTVLWLLKESEYEKYIEEICNEFDVDINKYATNQFKVKKIKYPTAY